MGTSDYNAGGGGGEPCNEPASHLMGKAIFPVASCNRSQVLSLIGHLAHKQTLPLPRFHSLSCMKYCGMALVGELIGNCFWIESNIIWLQFTLPVVHYSCQPRIYGLRCVAMTIIQTGIINTTKWTKDGFSVKIGVRYIVEMDHQFYYIESATFCNLDTL